MSKKDRRKLEKKRRKQQKRRRECSSPLPYHGNKYKTDKYTDLIFQTEAGVYESYVMEDRRLTDHDMRRALENLIRDIRSGVLHFSASLETDSDSEDNTLDLIIWNIRRHWQIYLEERPQPPRDDVVGILRTILGSIENWGSPDPQSRGYLRFLEDFMGELGVHCEKVPPDYESLSSEDDYEEDQDGEDELLTAGRAWIHDAEPGAATVFRALADEMINSGEAEQVAETCRQLIDETADHDLSTELNEISCRAQQRSSPPRRGLFSTLARLLGR